MYGNFGQDSQTFIISKSKQLYLQAMNKWSLNFFISQPNKLAQHTRKACLMRNNYNFSMQNIKKHKLGVAIDIDGTLVLKNKILPGAKEALQKLIQLDIPYLLLTNNISPSQQYKAAEINKIFNLTKPLTEKHVILNYTPFKQKLQKFGQGIVLVIGRQVRLNQVMPLPFIKNYITIDQYASIFPQALPLSVGYSAQKIRDPKEQLRKRLKLQSFNKHEMKIAGIYILTVPNNWEKSYQIIIDLLSTNDGTVSTQKFYKYAQNHIPVVVGYNDLLHITHEHNLPRLLMKPFTEGLKAIYKAVYHQDLRIQIYGKPSVSVFQFSKRQLEGQYGPIDKMVMIGDNEGSDIIGAYNSLWDSILVKTGVASLDSQFATVNAENIFQGINQYLSMQQA